MKLQANEHAGYAGNIHSSDVFRSTQGTPKVAAIIIVWQWKWKHLHFLQMPRHLNKMAATILTISDVIPTGDYISSDQRQNSLSRMTELAMESL
ncbi:MAG: hypothetical protein IPP27_15330 [Bacteroidetes bacterium]|nr:hypothetical protein [Bacteroidota bacterium]